MKALITLLLSFGVCSCGVTQVLAQNHRKAAATADTAPAEATLVACGGPASDSTSSRAVPSSAAKPQTPPPYVYAVTANQFGAGSPIVDVGSAASQERTQLDVRDDETRIFVNLWMPSLPALPRGGYIAVVVPRAHTRLFRDLQSAAMVKLVRIELAAVTRKVEGKAGIADLYTIDSLTYTKIPSCEVVNVTIGGAELLDGAKVQGFQHQWQSK